jgi:hypothetical protein
MTVKRLWASALVASSLVIGFSMVGCGGDKDTKTSTPPTTSGSSTKKAESGGGAPASSGEKTALKADGWATIKGRVTFAGTLPAQTKIPIPPDHKDKDYCANGDLTDPSLIVGADKGVENVVVWIRPPKDKFFDIPADQQKPAQMQVKVDQPFCAFTPHVTVLFPSFFDGKEQKKTGQTFEVANSATITHNTNWTPGDSRINQGGNQIINSKQDLPVTLNAAQSKKAGQEDLVSLKCNIHTWMTGYVWAFDHPYAAVTKADGTYEIKNVPAGADLHLVAWQEKMNPEKQGFVLPEGKGDRQGQEIGSLKSGETKTVDFKIGQ